MGGRQTLKLFRFYGKPWRRKPLKRNANRAASNANQTAARPQHRTRIRKMSALKDKAAPAAAQTPAPETVSPAARWAAVEAAWRLAEKQEEAASAIARAAANAVSAEAETPMESSNWPRIYKDPRVAPLAEAHAKAKAAAWAALEELVTTPPADWRGFYVLFDVFREYLSDVLNPLDARDLKNLKQREKDFPGTTVAAVISSLALASHAGLARPDWVAEIPRLLGKLERSVNEDNFSDFTRTALATLKQAAKDLIAAPHAVPTPPPQVALDADADAELLALGAELERRWAIEHQRSNVEGDLSDEELDAVCDYTGEIARQIEEAHATTLAGYRVKARAIAWRLSCIDEPIDTVQPAGPEAAQLINDLMGQPRWTSDGELLRLGERYKKMYREEYLLTGHLVPGRYPEAAVRAKILDEGLRSIRERAYSLRATTPEARRVKAIMALDWAPTEDFDDFKDEAHVLARSLIADVLDLPTNIRDGRRDEFWKAEGYWPATEEEADAEVAAILAKLGVTQADRVAA